MDAALVGQLVSGAVAIFTTALSLYSRHRSKVMENELANEAALLQGILGRTEALEMALVHANRREGRMAEQIRQLENRLHEKDVEFERLRMRYEALKENHQELADRYRVAVDELVKNYARRTQPPPEPESYPHAHIPLSGKLPHIK